MKETSHLFIRMLLVGTIVTLIIALTGGLKRMGWNLPTHPKATLFHGPLMVCGFLGTLITLERAKGIGYKIAYIAPLLTIIGSSLLLTDCPKNISISFIIAGSLGLFVILAFITRVQLDLSTATLTAGSLFWIAGNLLWLKGAVIFGVVPWWASFLIVTIAAERLGLSKIKGISKGTKVLFLLCIPLLAIGSIYSLSVQEIGTKIMGTATLLIAIWLISNDISRITIHHQGLSRFMAVNLLSGYIWLGVGGIITLIYTKAITQVFIYDFMVHSIFIGLLFSMIFAHAPVIFPSILGLQINYTPYFYFHTILLNISLCIRAIGNLNESVFLRNIGGLMNSIAILIFLVSTFVSIWASTTKSKITNSL